MKVLIIGAHGMLGQDLVKSFSKHYQVVAATRSEIDITNVEMTFSKIKEIKPNLVINSAAFTSVDECESNRDLAYSINGYGAGNVAAACEDINSKILHISTDYVFDGSSKKPYLEDDIVNPINTYGKSKLLGENTVKSFCKRHYIVRTQWLFGDNGNNFVKTILSLAKSQKSLKVVNDQFGSPTYTKDLSEALLEMILNPAYGTYHITNSGECSWYDFACAIIKKCNLKNIIINPCKTIDFPRPATRPIYSSLLNYRTELEKLKKMRNYDDALNDYLKSNDYFKNL